MGYFHGPSGEPRETGLRSSIRAISEVPGSTRKVPNDKTPFRWRVLVQEGGGMQTSLKYQLQQALY